MPPDAISVLASAGAIASWQPPLLAHFRQSKNLFAGRALLQAGVKIAFGTNAHPLPCRCSRWRSIAPVRSIGEVRGRMTVVGGRVAYE